MTKRIIALLMASIILMFGCSYKDLQDKLIPDAESTYAKDFLQKMQSRDFEYLKSQLDASLINQVTDEKLLEIAEYFPSGDLISVELIGSQIHTINSRWVGNFTFEYHFSDGWAVANTATKRLDGKISVIGFNVYRTPASQQELNSFSAVELTPLRILIFVLTVASPAFMFFTCYKVYKTPIPTKKKRWYFISLLGICGFAFNWTSGAMNFQLVSVHLLGAGVATAGSSAPWILSFTLPLGAVIFWIRRNDLMGQPGPSDLDTTVVEPAAD